MVQCMQRVPDVDAAAKCREFTLTAGAGDDRAGSRGSLKGRPDVEDIFPAANRKTWLEWG